MGAFAFVGLHVASNGQTSRVIHIDSDCTVCFHWKGRRLPCTQSRPTYVYNVPGRTGQDIEPHVMEQISDHPHFIGVKVYRIDYTD